MVRPHAALALCLLSLVAASVAQDDPGTETRADPVTEAVSYYEVMSKLPVGCGGCNFWGAKQRPCFRRVKSTFISTYPCGSWIPKMCTRIEKKICKEPYCCKGYYLKRGYCVRRKCGHCCMDRLKRCTLHVSLDSGKNVMDMNSFKWLTPLSGTTGKCALQGVLQLSPPAGSKTLTLHMKFNNPTEWSFNLGDSPTNNGWAGDAGTFPGGYAAEIHNRGSALQVWKNDLHPDCNSANMYNIAGAITTELTIRVSKNQLCVYNGDGGLIYKQNKCLFLFDTMYLGMNRVIHTAGRHGTGLCEVCGYWSNMKVADM